MEILRRHYEKMILGVFLLIVLGTSWLVLADLRTVGREIEGYRANTKALKSATAGEAVKPLDPKQFKAETCVFDPKRLEWKADESADTETETGDLMNPRQYMRCANPECPYYILYDQDVCPFCHTKQGKKTKKGSGGEDLDRDGIPDSFEKKYKALDPNVATDADRDYDGDWFTNRQEYEANTSPDDPTSHPPYAEKLRFLGTIRKPLDILFTRLIRNNKDDPNTWDGFFRVKTKGKWKSRIRRIGEKAGPYKILKFHYKTEKVDDSRGRNPATTKDVSDVVLQKGNEEPITLVRKKTTYEKGVIIRFGLLCDPYSPARCRNFTAKKGVPFTIDGPGGQKETWVVTDVAPRSVVVKRPDSKPDDKGITVKPVNYRKDFVRLAVRAAGQGPAGEMMMPGGRMTPNATRMPGPGPAAMPRLPGRRAGQRVPGMPGPARVSR